MPTLLLKQLCNDKLFLKGIELLHLYPFFNMDPYHINYSNFIIKVTKSDSLQEACGKVSKHEKSYDKRIKEYLRNQVLEYFDKQKLNTYQK